ncbi:MAG: ATP-dependent DNA helicase RecG, partial [Candidatus Riflebacteria bacterium]|nr:ATP-dependent DNA helicase RecG [Candidatus Riflebacteria bacterium]
VVVHDRQGLFQRAEGAFSFRFTGAQRRVLEEIRQDLMKPRPMARLLQGDVGSGKTAVALTALLAAWGDGHQGALMAPTEILAEQHYLSIRSVCRRFGVNVGLLVGAQGKREREDLLTGIASGEIHIAVGTHALIEETVAFRSLGLVVVDEQHRFGVAQRNRLVSKGAQPNVLVMTATPIPRTLSLTLYGDLDVSVLDELPPGRQPIRTIWHPPSKIDQIYRVVDREIESGGQAFVVCPLVEESEEVARTNAVDLHQALAIGPLSHRRVGLLHGQMRSADKESTMARFRAGELDILVSTTVVEVGVDVPNASVMVVVDADAFGLAQLHQLRGRIGRGSRPSTCYLVAASRGPDVKARLSALVGTQDGFVIAQRDLELRGPGEFFGMRQSGLPDLKVADLATDVALLEEARFDAVRLLAADPELTIADHSPLARVVEEKYRALIVH